MIFRKSSPAFLPTNMAGQNFTPKFLNLFFVSVRQLSWGKAWVNIQIGLQKLQVIFKRTTKVHYEINSRVIFYI